MAEKKRRNQYAYDKRAYDHLHIQVPKGLKQQLQDIAKAKNYPSLNAYTKALYEKDSGLCMEVEREE